MKYFKITDLTTGEEHFVSSTLPNETPAHVAMSAHLDLEHKYNIEEVTSRAFYGFPECTRDPDIDDDEDREDYEDYCLD